MCSADEAPLKKIPPKDSFEPEEVQIPREIDTTSFVWVISFAFPGVILPRFLHNSVCTELYMARFQALLLSEPVSLG